MQPQGLGKLCLSAVRMLFGVCTETCIFISFGLEGIVFCATFVALPRPSQPYCSWHMPPCGCVGFEQPLASSGTLGMHRLVEAMKHAFALRMNLGELLPLAFHWLLGCFWAIGLMFSLRRLKAITMSRELQAFLRCQVQGTLAPTPRTHLSTCPQSWSPLRTLISLRLCGEVAHIPAYLRGNSQGHARMPLLQPTLMGSATLLGISLPPLLLPLLLSAAATWKGERALGWRARTFWATMIAATAEVLERTLRSVGGTPAPAGATGVQAPRIAWRWQQCWASAFKGAASRAVPIHLMRNCMFFSLVHSQAILDNGTLALDAYGGRWNVTTAGLHPEDHGTSHLSVVDADR